jgi:hypothetical protein
LKWNHFFVDEKLHTIFFCFNSSEKAKWAKANLAKGFVTERQLLQRAHYYEVQVRHRPEIADFFKIALVHHHPYEYGSVPTALYERFFAQFFKGDQRSTKFVNADEFMQWCATRGVSLVLHGHKHVPHWLITSVDTPRGPQEITVVGCGSSTGVDKRPMCYDIVTIDPARKRCNVAFYQDERGDGAGFELQNVAIDLSFSSYNQDLSSEEPSSDSAAARLPRDRQELRAGKTEDKRHRPPDPADTPQRMVFVSYPRDVAQAIMKSLVSGLIDRGFRVWLWKPTDFDFSRNELKKITAASSGKDYLTLSVSNVESADVVLFLISAWTLQSDFQKRELITAWKTCPVVPCIVEDAFSHEQLLLGLLPGLETKYVTKITERMLGSKEGDYEMEMLLKAVAKSAGG